MSDTDFAAIAPEVAQKLLGDPNKGHSHALEQRWGKNGSKSLDVKTGLWFDHEVGLGGGVIDLVMHEKKLDKAGAIEWLEANGFLQPREKSVPVAQERQEAPEEGDDDSPEPSLPLTDAPDEREIEVEHYDYANADGEFQYRVIRYRFEHTDGTPVLGKHGNPKKTFRQRSRDAAGNKVWGLNGREVCLYRWREMQLAIEAGKTAFICEGEKDVHTLEAWGFAATTNSGGAQNWKPERFASTFRGADVVILGDDDEAGRERCETIALSLRGVAARIRVHHDWNGQKDVTDWKERAGGDASKLGEILNALPDWSPKPPVTSFTSMTIADAIARGHRAHSWLVQDLIELGGSCSFAGFTQSAKSFLAIELSFCVSRGIPFFGRDVKQGLVIYQVGEGATGFMKRVEGYAQDRGITTDAEKRAIPFIILPQKINLFVDDKDTDELIKFCNGWKAAKGLPLRLIVIDTFNKATRGSNEISGQDNGKIIDRVERIARECDCTVMVVDHLSAQGRLRGHTSKSDDMTTVIKVSITNREDRNNRKVREMRLDKNKDGENGIAIPFVIRMVPLGVDEDGHEVTTCVVDSPDGDDVELAKQGRLSPPQATVLRCIRDTAEIEGTKAPPELVQVPPGRNVVTFAQVKARLHKGWAYKAPDSDPAAREAELKRAFTDAIRRLQLAGFLNWDNDRGLIWWTGKEDRPRAEPKPESKPPPLPADVRKEIADQGVPF
jgi:5S rRNA maturation endonuclease (ribonuclease M5)